MQNLFKRFFQPSVEEEKIARLYGRIMAAARSEAFFLRYGLPDEFETRFELLVLHLFLMLTRLEELGQAGRVLARQLLESMVADLDRTVREMGVGDVGVVKRMKNLMNAFYGRAHAYRDALAAADERELLRALDRNLYGAASTDLAKLKEMRGYILRQQEQLKKLSLDDLLADRDIFLPADNSPLPPGGAGGGPVQE